MKRLLLIALMLLCGSVPSHAKGPRYTNPNKADADFSLQGEYAGTIQAADSEIPLGVQVIALGDGRFRAVGFPGGLPGDGWDGENRYESDAMRSDEGVVFQNDHARGLIKPDGTLTISSLEGTEWGQLERVQRQSPTLGKQPPEGAVVLFDGTQTDHWKGASITSDGLLMQGTTSKSKFQSHHLHLEFLLPYQPLDRGQQRGNSGVYLQGRYEVQMLDSFGLEGKDNECGGIYSIKEPNVNMCFPPLTWQTYDIDFTAAKYDSDGNLIQHPRMTVRHNGVLIHRQVELPKSTTAAPIQPGPDLGPVYLQDHRNPVRYRNIWVLPVEDQ